MFTYSGFIFFSKWSFQFQILYLIYLSQPRFIAPVPSKHLSCLPSAPKRARPLCIRVSIYIPLQARVVAMSSFARLDRRYPVSRIHAASPASRQPMPTFREYCAIIGEWERGRLFTYHYSWWEMNGCWLKQKQKS